MSGKRGERFALVGVGTAACAACCAPPLFAFLAGLTLAGVTGTAIFGIAAGVLAALVASGLIVTTLIRRRRHNVERTAVPATVSLATPTRRNHEKATL